MRSLQEPGSAGKECTRPKTARCESNHGVHLFTVFHGFAVLLLREVRDGTLVPGLEALKGSVGGSGWSGWVDG